MADVYGRRWYAEHGDAPNETWRQALMQISLERAAATIKKCIEYGDTYPCNLSQFMSRARELKIHDYAYKRLPDGDVVPPERAREIIAELKRKLGLGDGCAR